MPSRSATFRARASITDEITISRLAWRWWRFS
jgi:hypothetical protein